MIAVHFAVRTLVIYSRVIKQHIDSSYVLLDNQISALFNEIIHILTEGA